MKQIWRRTGKKIGVLLMACALLATTLYLPSHAAGLPVSVKAKENKVPNFQAGEKGKISLVVKNNATDGTNLTNVTIEPVLEGDNGVWPFQTEFQSYKKEIGNLAAGEDKTVDFEFVPREDLTTGRYAIQFLVKSTQGMEESQKIFVNGTGKKEVPQEAKPEQKEEANKGGEEMPAVSNMEAAYTGGGSTGGNSSVPRVIVTGFTTNPSVVKAGTDFTLTVHLRNTSKTTRVSNMLFDFNAPTEGSDANTTAPAFLPTSGASSVYLEGIPAGGTADISIALNAKADLLQKPYGIQLNMKYEDANAAQIQAESHVSIPVKQEARFEFSKMEVNPESIAVGEEGNVMTTLYNLGKIKLYNVKAKFAGEGIEDSETFVGNIEAGGKGSIDAMLVGKKETKGPAKVTMTLTYEDEAGKETSLTKDFKVEITAKESEETSEMTEEPVKSGGAGKPIFFLGGLLGLIIAGVVIGKKIKAKKAKAKEEELRSELDRSIEDEQ